MAQAWRRLSGRFVKGLWDDGQSPQDRPVSALAWTGRLMHALYMEYSHGQMNFRAMSLVYTTMLSLVPLLAVCFSVLKAFGVQNQAEPFLANLLAPLGTGGEEITRKVIGFVNKMKVGVLGGMGLAMLVYTVTSIVSKMEDSLNYIWRIKQPRSLSRRFTDYMSVLLVGPIMVFSAIGLTAAIKSSSFTQKLLSFGPAGPVFYLLGLLIPYISMCAAFTFIYIFLPNTKVRLSSGLMGGVFAGVAWQITGWCFASFVVTSAQYSAIYSGFAIIVLFMMWMYLSWLIFLAGASVSFYHQYPWRLVPGQRDFALSARFKERLAVSVMFLVAERSLEKGPCHTLETLAGRLRVPAEALQETLAMLENGGFLAQACDGPACWLPAKDVESVTVGEVMERARRAGEETCPFCDKISAMREVERVIARMEEASALALKDETFRSLVVSHKNQPGMG